MGLIVSELRQTPVGEQELEIVERKGLGHPDHICDAVMNEVSISLSREYIKRYGIVMHHNIDKALLAAGALRRNFRGGGGKRPKPTALWGRATHRGDGAPVPLNEIAVSIAKKWLSKKLPLVHP